MCASKGDIGATYAEVIFFNKSVGAQVQKGVGVCCIKDCTTKRVLVLISVCVCVCVADRTCSQDFGEEKGSSGLDLH